MELQQRSGLAGNTCVPAPECGKRRLYFCCQRRRLSNVKGSQGGRDKRLSETTAPPSPSVSGCKEPVRQRTAGDCVIDKRYTERLMCLESKVH